MYDCFGEWAWPEHCKKDCDYKISWAYTPENDIIEFVLDAKLSQNSWTGVGFSLLESMNNADIIAIRSHNGILSLHDMYLNKNGKNFYLNNK